MEGLWYYFCAVFMAFSSKYEDYASIRNEMEEVSHRLISWYESHKRALPWRETSDPYAIWVSEIILQQTRVAQGYDYYVRFMHAFPSVGALAEADEDQVLRLWQGLGYYSRARNMHAAAKQIVAQGSFPTTYEAILNLKGVGPYTAAAIASFAFGLPHVVVDGNVCRLMARLFAVEEPIDTSNGKSQVESLAKALMPEGQSALFNQAVMEFGALQCVPTSPRCEECPLADKCLALSQGRVEALPRKSHRTKVTERYFHYFLIEDGESLYLRKRTDDDIWRGLYELPLKEVASPDADEETLPVKSVRHVLSHQVIHASLYRQTVVPPLPPREGCIVVRWSDLDDYALPRLVQILLE